MTQDADPPPFRPPDERMIPEWRPEESGRPARPGTARPGTARPGTALDDELVVRPFVVTGGRTAPRTGDIRVETLLETAYGVRLGTLRFESLRIVEICREPTSLAEVAARLTLPIGVTRVLVSDLVAAGTLIVTRAEELSIQTIERVRDRVRSL